MCRERDVERQLGDADLLTSVQPPTEKDGGGTKPPKGLSVKLGSTNPDKEQERLRELEKREDLVRPVLGPRKTSAQSPRLLPYFPKSAMTSPPQPKSLARNPSPISRATARNPSPGPAARAAAAAATTITSSTTTTSAARPRNPSPAPASRTTARNPSPGPAPRATARNPSPTPASKATARNPSPGPASRATARNPSPTPASKATARNPSPSPGISRANARNPSPASKVSARSSSPAGVGARASVTSAGAAAAANGVKPGLTRSNSSLASGGRRAVSPSVTRREMRSAPGASRTSPGDGAKKSMPSVLFPSSKPSQPFQPSLMSTSCSSDGSSSKEEYPPESPICVKRLSTSALEDLQALRNLKMSSSSSDGSSSTTSTKGELPSSECSSPVTSSKKLAVLDFDALRKYRESCSSSDGLSTKEESLPEAESPTISGKKLSAMEVQLLKKHRLLNSLGKRAGPPKAGRVACEGMLPTSPVGSGVVIADTRKRCHWITPQSEPILIAYHDEEWGVPVHNDKMLFELMVLEGAQSELSRPQILGLRDYFREVFAGFDPEVVARFDEKKISSLAADDVIRQTEAKVRGVVENAKQVVKIAQEFGSFNKYLWMFVGFKPIVNLPRLFTQVPVKSSKSEALSRDLMRRGFRYVGPTTIYSFMQAAGMVNDHLTGCFRHSQCNSTPQTTATTAPPSLATATAVAESSEKRVY